MCVKGFLVLVLVLDWTRCLPQGAGAPPAMLQSRMTGIPKIWGPGPPERQDKVDTLDCGTPTTCRLYPFGTCVCEVVVVPYVDAVVAVTNACAVVRIACVSAERV